MGRTKGAKNKAVKPPKEVLLSESEKLQLIAEIIYEIVMDEELEGAVCKEP